MSDSPAYLNAVKDWMNSANARTQFTVAAVTKVTSDGSDWEGDTNHGFYSTFGLDITYRDPDGTERTDYFNGEALASLWEFVIGTLTAWEGHA